MRLGMLEVDGSARRIWGLQHEGVRLCVLLLVRGLD